MQRDGSLAGGGCYDGAVNDAEQAQELASWTEEFEAAARRPLRLRMRYAFIKTYRPVLDDERFRAFDRMADYRQWCETSLPRLRAFRDYWASRRRG